MKVEMKVHGVSTGQSSATTEIEGEVVQSTVPTLDVELVTTADRHGSLVLRFVGGSKEAAKALFTTDALIEATFVKKAGV